MENRVRLSNNFDNQLFNVYQRGFHCRSGSVSWEFIPRRQGYTRQDELQQPDGVEEGPGEEWGVLREQGHGHVSR